MIARATRCLLVACLLAGEPLHGWLHAGGASQGGAGQQIHDGACEHQPAHPSDHDCLLCGGGRSGPAARIEQSLAWRHDPGGEMRVPYTWSGPGCCSAPHRLGARAPPILG